MAGYRVDVLINETRTFTAFTGPKRPVVLAMAQAYRNHLQRGKAGGRIVELPSGKIVEEWEAK